MTGWRLGWLVAPPDAVPALERLAQNLYISAVQHCPARRAGLLRAATIEILEQRRHAFAERRDWLLPALRGLGFDIPVQPQGAFYLYADIGRFSDDAQAFCAHFLETEHVAFTPASTSATSTAAATCASPTPTAWSACRRPCAASNAGCRRCRATKRHASAGVTPADARLPARDFFRIQTEQAVHDAVDARLGSGDCVVPFAHGGALFVEQLFPIAAFLQRDVLLNSFSLHGGKRRSPPAPTIRAACR
jgi:hypothetical protein